MFDKDANPGPGAELLTAYAVETEVAGVYIIDKNPESSSG
jgi:hypothetical protein